MFLSNNESYPISTTGFAGTTNSPDHYEKNKFEKEYVLRKTNELFGDPPPGSQLHWKGYEHDFGMYFEMTLSWNSNDEKLYAKCWEWINHVEIHDWDNQEHELREFWNVHEAGAL